MTIGTILLMLPISNAQGHSTTLVDAAFTAVSCVSVTGLSTVDTYHHWSLFGKIVMVILIQLGWFGDCFFYHYYCSSIRATGRSEKSRAFVRGCRARWYERASTHYEEANHLYLLCRNNWGIIYTIQLYPYIGDAALYTGIMQSISSFVMQDLYSLIMIYLMLWWAMYYLI